MPRTGLILSCVQQTAAFREENSVGSLLPSMLRDESKAASNIVSLDHFRSTQLTSQNASTEDARATKVVDAGKDSRRHATVVKQKSV